MRILTIDPGHTTGMAFHDFTSSDKPETLMPVGLGNAYNEFFSFIANNALDLVVCEKFTITSATSKKSRGGSNEAIELIGVARYMAWDHSVSFEEQSPADAKNFCSDEKLRRLGWYVSGLDHARDALRHLVLAGVRHKVLDPSTLIH